MKIYYNPTLKPLARNLRKKGTFTEVLLWDLHKNRQMKGYKFTRQKPIGNYIVDFFCNKLRLVIEIDGITHENKEKVHQTRQGNIEKMDIRFLRFLDSDVRNNLSGVDGDIENWIKKTEIKEGISPKTPPFCPPL